MPVQAPASNSAAPGLLASVLLSLARSPKLLLRLMRRKRGTVPKQLSSTTYQQQLLLRESCAARAEPLGTLRIECMDAAVYLNSARHASDGCT